MAAVKSARAIRYLHYMELVTYRPGYKEPSQMSHKLLFCLRQPLLFKRIFSKPMPFISPFFGPWVKDHIRVEMQEVVRPPR